MQTNHPLTSLNTWGVGGKCSYFCAPKTVSELRNEIKTQLALGSLYILGGGSNVLIADGQIDASVIHTPGLNGISLRRDTLCGDTIELTAECGVAVKDILALALKNDLGGVEFLTGIPGTLGGALWGNAGAAGESFAQCVKIIETIEKNGETRVWESSELCWKYRTCPWTSDTLVITKCILSLRETPRKNILNAIKKFSSLKKGQPLGRKTAGCVFKNPADNTAGALLDRAGCKGLRIGGAEVSRCHANFIENVENAAASDIFSLGELCRKRECLSSLG